jgi:membrane fusion protein (multidrug efflux system)
MRRVTQVIDKQVGGILDALPPDPGETIEPVRANGNGPARKKRLLLLGGVVLLGAVGYPAYILAFGTPGESTDDAYVAGDSVTITSREAGTVIALHADDTQGVVRGQPLIELDPATADVDLASAEADLARSVRDVRSAFARVDESHAGIVSAQADFAKARDDLLRRQSAAGDGAVSDEEESHAADAVRTTRAALDLARSRRVQALSSVSGTTTSDNPAVLAAVAAVRRAAIVRSHMRIVAPVDGIVAQRTAQLGQQVAAGMPLMTVVRLRNVWVDANFRETQLADLRVGQPARIRSDVYGRRISFHGRVLGLGAGSGNAFALLPPQNASGNWIKIVQRVPVRIALDPIQLDRNPLQIGVSVKVDVDTSDHSGAPVANHATGILASEASEDGGSAINREILRVIAANRAKEMR